MPLQRQNARINTAEPLRLDERAIAAIEAIIQRGNNAEIRRKGKGYVVLEDEKTIKYHAPAE